MSRTTRSTTKAAAAPIAQPPQDDYVTVNWVFFHSSHPHDKPLPIKLPRQLFEGPADDCCDLFVSALANRFAFKSDRNSITFWQPIEDLSINKACKKGWTESITDAEDVFNPIPLPVSFAESLDGQIDDKKRVHLVVTAEGHYLSLKKNAGHEEERDTVGDFSQFRKYRAFVAKKGLSPSRGAKASAYARIQAKSIEAIHDGRHPKHPRFETIAPPIEIFNPVFGRFLRHCHTVETSKKDLIKVQELMQLASEIWDNEREYALKIRAKLSEVLRVSLSKEENADQTSADGVYSFTLGYMRIPIFIMELKKEYGEGGCDASTQAGLSMKRSWLQVDRTSMREKCCCPTLILAGGGPWLGVLGGVLTDKLIIQRLTDMMWIGDSSMYEDGRLYHVTQALVALREALRELKMFYKSLYSQNIAKLDPKLPHPRFFPYPTSFTEKMTTISVDFKYLKPLQDDARCVTFLAETEDNSLVVVKFVDRYGREVHEFLAEEGHAPRLRYCGPLLLQPDQPPLSSLPPPGLSFGPLQMVVMDY
ncbi:hypothetical protein BDQ12DRAFT_694237, partial [Crucibulum laeve]